MKNQLRKKVIHACNDCHYYRFAHDAFGLYHWCDRIATNRKPIPDYKPGEISKICKNKGCSKTYEWK